LNERAEFYRFVYAGSRVKAVIGDLEMKRVWSSKIHSSISSLTPLLLKYPILIVYPGITGTSKSEFAQNIGLHFKKKNFNVLIANHRGMNSELTVKQINYH